MDNDKILQAFKENKERIDKGAARPGAKAVRVSQIDVKAIRTSLGMSQSEFALAFWISLGNIRNWEQGIRTPQGPARAYLTVIQHNAEAVLSALEKSIIRKVTDRAQSSSERKEYGSAEEGIASLTALSVETDGSLRGFIEPISMTGGGQRIAASSKKSGPSKDLTPLAQLVDYSGLIFAKLFRKEDFSIAMEVNSAAAFHDLQLGEDRFRVRFEESGHYSVMDLNVAKLILLLKNGAIGAWLNAKKA